MLDGTFTSAGIGQGRVVLHHCGLCEVKADDQDGSQVGSEQGSQLLRLAAATWLSFTCEQALRSTVLDTRGSSSVSMLALLGCMSICADDKRRLDCLPEQAFRAGAWALNMASRLLCHARAWT